MFKLRSVCVLQSWQRPDRSEPQGERAAEEVSADERTDREYAWHRLEPRGTAAPDGSVEAAAGHQDRTPEEVQGHWSLRHTTVMTNGYCYGDA